MNTIKKFIGLIKGYNQKYSMAKNSASLSFYMLISLLSLLIIIFQIVAYTSDILQTLLLPRILNILTENFQAVLQSALPTFSLSSFSTIIFLNLIWAASRTINGYNRIADDIYLEIKPRYGLLNRLSAFLMFAMFILVFIFELFIILIVNNLIQKAFTGSSFFVVKFFQFIFELFIIFLTILILYLYAPPKKMKVCSVYKGALLSSILIYGLLLLFVLIFNILMKFGVGYSIITVISLSLLVLYYGNYIIISGLIINYFGNIFELKKSIFSK